MTNAQDQILADQRDAARLMGDDGDFSNLQLKRRPTLMVVPKVKTTKPASKVSLKGHEAYLKALEGSGSIVKFEKMSSGDTVIGAVKTSDKYTVSLQTKEGTRVLFKHDISEFFVAAPGQVH